LAGTHPEVVNDEQRNLAERCDRSAALAGRASEKQIFEEHVGFAIQYAKTGVDRSHADRLSDVAFANARVAEQQNVLVLFDKSAVSQVEDERAIDCIELPVERVE
jgi:hypothetical protein